MNYKICDKYLEYKILKDLSWKNGNNYFSLNSYLKCVCLKVVAKDFFFSIKLISKITFFIKHTGTHKNEISLILLKISENGYHFLMNFCWNIIDIWWKCIWFTG